MSATATETDLEQRAINVIRGLCMDGPEAAHNGHPGTGMALAPLAHVLFTRVMTYDASYIDWPDRDRFGAGACDHRTFVSAGDGCLEEGISHEAGSLAGHLELGRLVYVYDDNHITIDGNTSLSYSDDAGKRFEAYGWHVENIGDVAND